MYRGLWFYLIYFNVSWIITEKITELTTQMEALCDELEKTKHQAQCEANRFRDIINEKVCIYLYSGVV